MVPPDLFDYDCFSYSYLYISIWVSVIFFYFDETCHWNIYRHYIMLNLGIILCGIEYRERGTRREGEGLGVYVLCLRGKILGSFIACHVGSSFSINSALQVLALLFDSVWPWRFLLDLLYWFMLESFSNSCAISTLHLLCLEVSSSQKEGAGGPTSAALFSGHQLIAWNVYRIWMMLFLQMISFILW